MRVLAGTDAGFTYVIPGFAIHDELEMLVQAGLSPREALLAATRNPAAFLGQENEWGSVAVGLRADLLLLPENPLLRGALVLDMATLPVGVGRENPPRQGAEPLPRIA
ncbi:MAG: amidohydrolase family protein [Gemmatimonadota bacterium]